MKQKCLEKLLTNLQRENDVHILESNYSDCIKVCSSIKSFLAGLDWTSKSRTASDYITSACLYNSDLSCRRLEKIIGTPRARINGLKVGLNAYLEVEDDAEDNSILAADDDDDDDIHQQLEEEDNYVIEDEPSISTSDDDEMDSEEEVVEVNTEGNEVQAALRIPRQVKAKTAAVLDAVDRIIATRKQRRDRVDLTFVRRYWHFDTVTQFDTDSSKKFLCYDPDTKGADLHRQRLQYKRTTEMHKEFLESEEYLRHLDVYPEQSIGLTLFKQAKCNCIKWDKLRKCADTREVQFKEYVRAQKRLCSKEECNCDKR